jgi:large subunit ribosomal protein L25
MSEYTFVAETRENLGKGASRRLRKENKIPAIVYGGAKNRKPQSITLASNVVAKAEKNEDFYSSVATITIGDKEEKVIIMDMQRHPYKPVIMHMDFERVTKSTMVTRKVPVHFVNEDTCVGVKSQGGMIVKNLAEIEIKCSALAIPSFIEVDMAAIENGSGFHLSDLSLDKAITLIQLSHGSDQAIASVYTPKGEVASEEEAAAE